jgi:hypothetical protein
VRNIPAFAGEVTMTCSPQAWRHPRSRAEATARLVGRWRYNERRQAAARQRRAVVQQAWLERGEPRGWQTRLARELRVHKATICRDVAAIKAWLGC